MNFILWGGFCWCKKENWYKGWKPKRKPNTATPVFQIEPNSLKVLNEWPSIIEASKALGINKNTIIRCCQNKGILAGNFHWCKIENWSQNWKPKEETLRTPPRKKCIKLISLL